MKNLKIVSSFCIGLFIFGCTTSEPNNSDANINQNDKAALTDSSTQKMATESDSSTTRLADMVGMYEDIGLTEDQIDKFEVDYKRKVESLKSYGRGDYDQQSIEATKDQSMRTVTSDEEYKRYLEWKKNNPVQY